MSLLPVQWPRCRSQSSPTRNWRSCQSIPSSAVGVPAAAATACVSTNARRAPAARWIVLVLKRLTSSAIAVDSYHGLLALLPAFSATQTVASFDDAPVGAPERRPQVPSNPVQAASASRLTGAGQAAANGRMARQPTSAQTASAGRRFAIMDHFALSADRRYRGQGERILNFQES